MRVRLHGASHYSIVHHIWEPISRTCVRMENFSEIVLPLTNDTFRIIWAILQLIGAILLEIFSVINISERKDLSGFIHLSFSSLALLLGTIDLFAVIIQKVIKCSTINRHYTQFQCR